MSSLKFILLQRPQCNGFHLMIQCHMKGLTILTMELRGPVSPLDYAAEYG